jgi:signal transduction histidine kinase
LGPLRRLSLRQKLPLFLVGLTAVTLAAAGFLAWGDVRGATRAAGEARLEGTARELADLARANSANRANLEREVGRDPAVQAALRGSHGEEGSTDGEATPADTPARAALQRLAVASDSGLAIELYAADRHRVIGLGEIPQGVDPTPPLDAVRAAGPFQKTDRRTMYWASTPILDGDRVLGWLAQLRRIGGNPQAAAQFTRLLGTDITFLFGNRELTEWADLGGGLAPAPPPGFPVDTAFSTTLPDGSPGLAVAAPLEGTPFLLLAQMPTSALKDRPAAFVRRMLTVGLGLILVIGLVGWSLSSRLTAPLVELATAADELSSDRHGRRVQADGGDELGRLARAFNAMADRVAASDEALRHRLEEARALAQRLEEANIAAERAREEAQSANRAKSEFLATMSHEIRTPINAVLGYTELMAQGIPDPPTEKQKGYLDRIDRSSRLLISLVNDVLDFARIESGEMKVQRGVGSAAEAIQTARAALDPVASRKGVALSTECDPELLFSADPRRVQQILLNLLTNAVKFTSKGGSVRVTCHAVDVGPEDAVDGSWLRVDVEDTGIGIEPEKLAHIFEPFIQGETGFAREHGGVGLGLAVSRRLASLLHGEITVRSTRGKGSCFSLWLPAVPSNEPAATT